MKRRILAFFAVVLTLILLLSACSIHLIQDRTCHKCGEPLGSDPIQAGGRNYCSYNCYMSEVLFD